MNFFNTHLDSRKIKLAIPQGDMKDAKRIFKHLKRTTEPDVYEVPESAENLAKCIELGALLVAKRNRKQANSSSKREYFENLEKQAAQIEEASRESLPEIQPTVMTVKEAVAICPALAEAISCVKDMMKENDFEVGGVCIPTGTLPPSLIAGGGPVLLLDMYDSTTADFVNHVCAVPEPMHFVTMDLMERGAANSWQVNRGEKMPIVYGVDLGFFEQLYTEELVNGRELERARVVILAGDHIAFGGHFRNTAIGHRAISFLFDIGAPTYTKEERQSAAEILSEHGRTPWLGNFFPGKSKAFALVPVARAELAFEQPDRPLH
jgi:hypothetical protein